MPIVRNSENDQDFVRCAGVLVCWCVMKPEYNTLINTK